ncbi:MAG: hypothetical protein IRZ10_04670 [Thermoflavifilum sp.]|nr:hypothetical protein [Thermoflavifilum sp.]MCL6513692.1 hypothetical protein [Alicyclobacillus sp.]
MVRRFWQTYAAIASASVAVSLLSWLAVWLCGLSIRTLPPLTAALTLPMGFPSLSDFAVPATAGPWLLWVVLFLVKVWLTGGTYGAFARVYADLPGGPAAFIRDGGRAFWRLLGWYVLWDSVGLAGALWLGDIRVTIPLWCVRWVFLYAGPALVCETQDSARRALGRAGRVWLRDWAASLGLAIAVAVTAAVCAGIGKPVAPGPLGLWLTLAIIIDGLAGAWWMHMTCARYAHLSGWVEGVRADRVTAADTASPRR